MPEEKVEETGVASSPVASSPATAKKTPRLAGKTVPVKVTLLDGKVLEFDVDVSTAFPLFFVLITL